MCVGGYPSGSPQAKGFRHMDRKSILTLGTMLEREVGPFSKWFWVVPSSIVHLMQSHPSPSTSLFELTDCEDTILIQACTCFSWAEWTWDQSYGSLASITVFVLKPWFPLTAPSSWCMADAKKGHLEDTLTNHKECCILSLARSFVVQTRGRRASWGSHVCTMTYF